MATTASTLSQSVASLDEAQVKSSLPQRVVIHPLALMSIADHYGRVAKDTNNRVCGILLGQQNKDYINVSTTFAVPFEEDTSVSDSWFLDHHYIETMYAMFRKVNSSEKIIGWYSTSRTISSSDLSINDVIKSFCTDPIYCIVDIARHNNKSSHKANNGNSSNNNSQIEQLLSLNNNNDNDSLIKVYRAVPLSTAAIESRQQQQQQKQQQEQKPTSSSSHVETQEFTHISIIIGAEEAEEVGIEDLLRNHNGNSHVMSSGSLSAALDELREPIASVSSGDNKNNDKTNNTLGKQPSSSSTKNKNNSISNNGILNPTIPITQRILDKLSAIQSVTLQLHEIQQYIIDVSCGKLPYNTTIMRRIQHIVSVLPVIAQAGTYTTKQQQLQQIKQEQEQQQQQHEQDNMNEDDTPVPLYTGCDNQHFKTSLSSQLIDKQSNTLTVLYIATLIRTITHLHSLIQNKEVSRLVENDAVARQKLIEGLNNATNATKKTGSPDDDDDITVDSTGYDKGDENKM